MRTIGNLLLFWQGILSNWAPTPLEGRVAWREMVERLDAAGIPHPAENVEISGRLRGRRYPNAEAWMMAAKAWLMNDMETMQLIQEATSPKDHKALGRRVKPFDARLWERACVPVVIAGSIAKFSFTQRMEDELLQTGNLMLVEASPYDQVWGIGLHWQDAKAEDPAQWRGRNLLGQCLVEARRVIAQRREG